VLCDSFGAKSVTVGNKTVKAGRPILYYSANTTSRDFNPLGDPEGKIYNYEDNLMLLTLKMDAEKTDDPLAGKAGPGMADGSFLYSEDYKLLDAKIYEATQTNRRWPYRPDSYILISAGVDGLYGTNDDICNF